MRYCIIRDGQIENIVEWDGKSDWQPPEGTTVRKAKDGDEITVDTDPPAPTLEDRLAAIEATLDVQP